MPASVRSSSSYASTASETSSTVPMPAGWQAGDVVYIGCQLTAANGSVTTPTGWSPVVAGFHSASGTSGDTSATQEVLRRVMQAGDPATLAISHTSGRLAAVLTAVKGADTANPEDGVTPATDGNTSVPYPNVRAPSVTPVSTSDLLLTFHGNRNVTNGATTTYTHPAGMTEVGQVTTAVASVSNAAIEVNSLALTDTSPTGTKTATVVSSSGTSINQCGAAIVVKGADATVTGAVAQVTVTAPAGSVTAAVSLAGATAQVAIDAPAGSVKAGATLSGVTAQVTIAAPAGSAAAAATVPGTVCAVTVACPAGTVTAGQTVAGAPAQVAITALAGSVTAGQTVPGQAAQITITAPAGYVVSPVLFEVANCRHLWSAKDVTPPPRWAAPNARFHWSAGQARNR